MGLNSQIHRFITILVKATTAKSETGPIALFSPNTERLLGMASESAQEFFPSRPQNKNKKPPLTHFVSIPLHNALSLPQLSTSLSLLTTDLVTNNDLVSASAVRPAITMHLTLGVMSLTTPADIQRAVDFVEKGASFTHLLQDSTPHPEEGGALEVSLEGLEAMGSRGKTSVLYAVPVDTTGRLQVFAEGVRRSFEREGLVVEEGRELKLHATVVNTVYASGGRRGGRKEVFDAVDVVDRYRGVMFAGEVVLDRVCVCKMGEVRVGGVSEGYLVVGEQRF